MTRRPVAETLACDCSSRVAQMSDRREIRQHQDVLVNMSAPFTDGLELTGPTSADLFFSGTTGRR